MKYLVQLLIVLAASFMFMPGQATAGDPTYDCTSGCYIVTCSGSYCTLWRCDANGCRSVSVFTQEKRLLIGGENEPAFENDRAFAKICPIEKTCSLYELTSKHATFLGDFDNIDAIIDLRQRRSDKSRP